MLDVIVQSGVRTPGAQISWSPDGDWIVLGTQSLELALVHPDGTEDHVVEVDLGSTGALGPSWSPDGTTNAFSRVTGGSLGNLHLVAPDGCGLLALPGTSSGAFANWTCF